MLTCAARVVVGESDATSRRLKKEGQKISSEFEGSNRESIERTAIISHQEFESNFSGESCKFRRRRGDWDDDASRLELQKTITIRTGAMRGQCVSSELQRRIFHEVCEFPQTFRISVLY